MKFSALGASGRRKLERLRNRIHARGLYVTALYRKAVAREVWVLAVRRFVE